MWRNRAWFKAFPQIQEDEIIQPSSEFRITCCGCRATGFLIFDGFAVLPLSMQRLQNRMAGLWQFRHPLPSPGYLKSCLKINLEFSSNGLSGAGMVAGGKK